MGSGYAVDREVSGIDRPACGQREGDQVGDGKRGGIGFSNATRYGGLTESYWTIMLQDVASALAGLGKTCSIKAPSPENVAAFLGSLERPVTQPDYVLLFNFNPQFSFLGGQESAVGLWKVIPVKLISLLLDHPLHHLEALTELRQFSETVPGGPPRHIGVMEEGHRRCLQALGFDVSRCFICPQGGPMPRPDRKLLRERTIEVLFAGTINDPVGDREFCDALGVANPALQRRIGAMTEAVIDGEGRRLRDRCGGVGR